MIKRMQRRLTVVLLLFLVGVYAGFCVVSYFASAGSMKRDGDMMLDRIDAPVPPDGEIPHMPGQVGVPFFTIRLNRSGAVTEMQKGQFELTDREAAEIAALVMDRGEDRGYLEEYKLRYFKAPESDGWRIVFTDESVREEMRLSQMRNSVVIGLLLLPVFYLFSRSVSAFVVRPVRRAWDQQIQFVADASHELKTPLTVILSNTDMILSDCTDGDEDLRRRAGFVREEAGRMRGLVMELLSLARSDAAPGKREALSRIDLTSSVETAALSFEAVAYESGLSLTAETEENVFIRAEEQESAQLLSILLDNAVKYSLPGGEICVTLRTERGKHAVISVSNSGEALDEEQLKKIFDRFYRVDRARSLRPGYGLGLSVARGIVSRWNGKIWADHRDGITTLWVRVPLDREG